MRFDSTLALIAVATAMEDHDHEGHSHGARDSPDISLAYKSGANDDAQFDYFTTLKGDVKSMEVRF